MRKSFDGLFGIIKSDLNLDVRDGGLFMFSSASSRVLTYPRCGNANATSRHQQASLSDDARLPQKIFLIFLSCIADLLLRYFIFAL